MYTKPHYRLTLQKMLGMLTLTCLLVTSVHASERKKVILQLTDNSLIRQTVVLNVADKLTETYKENIDLEIVAFGPGLQLFFADNTNSERLDKLAKDGVRFSVCRNTVRKLRNKLGEDEVALHKHAHETHSGPLRIIELVEQGYILMHP